MTGQDSLNRLWSDAANWTRGGFYRCAADPRMMVLKRVGAGYTINIAHQRSWLVLIGLLVVTMAPLVVNIALGRRAPEWLFLVTLLWPLTVAVITLVWLSRRVDS
jgi:Family of unknown function (DUF5808)